MKKTGGRELGQRRNEENRGQGTRARKK